MSDPLLPEGDGATPLTDDEREGLKLSYVTTRGDLNAAEQQSILKAQTWAQKRKHKVLTRAYLNDLHQRMYGDVWNWGGKYRRTEKNIGIDPIRIQTALQELLDNVNYWIEHKAYPPVPERQRPSCPPGGRHPAQRDGSKTIHLGPRQPA